MSRSLTQKEQRDWYRTVICDEEGNKLLSRLTGAKKMGSYVSKVLKIRVLRKDGKAL